jgi:hypothetical protein
MGQKLFVGGLPSSTSTEECRDQSPIGPVRRSDYAEGTIDGMIDGQGEIDGEAHPDLRISKRSVRHR